MVAALLDPSKAAELPEFMKRATDDTRPLKVICIGAGIQGILLAIKLPRVFSDVTLKVYERNPSVGGTWYNNKYAGVACDIPSHAYQASFAPNTRWSKYYSGGAEILAYWEKVAQDYGAQDFMTFNTNMEEARWDENTAKWTVTLKDTQKGSVFVDECDVLVGAYGFLSKPKYPDIPGLKEFTGTLVHPAHWDSKLDWAEKRVAVIGNGSSAIQVVPAMAKTAKLVHNYARSATWISAGAAGALAAERGSKTENFDYTPDDFKAFEADPVAYKAYVQRLNSMVNSNHSITIRNSPLALGAQEATTALMKQRSLADPSVVERMLPTWNIGCRRLTPGIGYIETLCEEHVSLITTPISNMDATGIVTKDGTHHDYDIIVVCSGFDVSFRGLPIYGKNGVNLQDLWGDIPESYIGMGAPQMPNYLHPTGPNGAVGSGTFMPLLEMCAAYICDFVAKLKRDRIRVMTPSDQAVRQFNDFCRDYFPYTVFSDDCGSWFRSAPKDKSLVTGLFPGSYLTYRQLLKNPRWEDFDIQYLDESRFQCLSSGLMRADMNQKGDFAPYISGDDWPELKADQMLSGKLANLKV